MNQDNDGYKVLIEYQPDAFAYQQIVLDDRGTPVDCVLIKVNMAFENMTGLKGKQAKEPVFTLPCPKEDYEARKTGLD